MKQFIDWYMNDALWFTITNFAGAAIVIATIGTLITFIPQRKSK